MISQEIVHPLWAQRQQVITHGLNTTPFWDIVQHKFATAYKMSEQPPVWKLTAKLPLLIGGLLLLLGGAFIAARGTTKAVIGGSVLISGGLAAIIWSASIHNWCVPDDMKWGNRPFNQMRFHDGPPSLNDCLALIGLVKSPNYMTFDQIKANAPK